MAPSGSLLIGALLIDKPAGITSHDVVEQVRKQESINGSKVGHSGTLDPFATGLLVVLVGAATKYQDRMVGYDKSYIATAQLGQRSSTGDIDGEICATGITTGSVELEAVLTEFRGGIEQVVPLTSAVKVEGEALYKRAHRGESMADRPKRSVEIFSLEFLTFDCDKQTAQLGVHCSKGTYIRQLVEDIGERLGCGAYCRQLRRTEIGPFSLDSAATIEVIMSCEDIARLDCWLPLKVSFGEISV